MKKKFLYLILFFCSLTLLSACGERTNSWQAIKERKTLVIGIDDSFVPMDFREKNGNLVGFDVDLAKAACKKLGLKPQFQPIDWDMKETELRNGTIDVIWNGYTKTKARAKKESFTEPYLKNKQILVTRKTEHIKNYQEMKGKILGLQTGSSGADAYDTYPKVLKDRVASTVQYDNYNDAFLDLKAGRINGLLIDSVYGDYYLKHTKDGNDFSKSVLPYPSEEFAIGVNKKDKTLTKKLNWALNELKKDGTISRLEKKWFN
ncbi:amino acid ABC transporter substrate-binding protein [Lactobacillus sp. PV034]|uniref:amino acid ABC transporter substrate-binding protein n=1 Tax=Lactobacillus sp. PV034 TaxID=2594495 RepID=UPI002240D097|nr:amino acid ABC transporter substrate-binding protein [Lactobacillus sp. PV034]QNQ81418.1 amino acid ABC transporter substrate-binding protein [Lactobacillus sp. PV034]